MRTHLHTSQIVVRMTGYMCLNGTPLGSVKMQSAPAATGHRIQLPGRRPAEPWRHECRNEQEDIVWMEQLEEDVRSPMRQKDTPHVKGNIHKMIVQPVTLYRMETVTVVCRGRRTSPK